jgi:hypothetical protein
MRVECVRLDQHTLEIQLTEQLLEFRMLVAAVGRVAVLRDRQPE